MLRTACWVVASGLLVALAGCARFPDDLTPPVTPPRTLVSQITVAGNINPSYYYFLALDTDGDPATGPVPIVTGSKQGNGWGTLSGIGPNDPVQEPPFYVQYHNGRFEQFRNGQPVGAPFRGTILAADGTPALVGPTLLVEIDVGDIAGPDQPVPDLLQLNWITNERIDSPPQTPGITKQYDGFGPFGNDYLSSLPLTVTQTLISGVGGVLEEELDTATTTSIADIDMIEWRVEVRIRTL